MIQLRTKSEIIAELKRRGIRLKKSLGQNFLIDHNVLDYIVRSAQVGKSDIVLEIGSGSGLLTRHLAEAAGHVVTVEIDERVADLCRDYTADLPNITMIRGDVLASKSKLNPAVEAAVQKLHEVPGLDHVKMVGNLPYSVGSVVIPLLLEGPLPIELMVLTVQKEVSDRLVAQPGNREYGSLSVIVQAHAEVRELKVLGPKVFLPPPAVHSAIDILTPTDIFLRQIEKYEVFAAVTRDLFLHRRKKAAGALALSRNFELSRGQIDTAFERAEVGAAVRADQLSVAQIVRLSNEIVSELTQ